MKRVPIASLLSLIVFLSGCGGGGGGGVVNQTGKQAAVAAAQGIVLFTQSNSAGNTTNNKAARGNANLVMGRIALNGFNTAHVERAAAWTFDPSLGLYFQIISHSGSSETVEFSTDGVHTNAGFIDATLLYGGHGVFPAAISLQFHLLSAAGTLTGGMTLTVYDSSFTNERVQMDLSYPVHSQHVVCELTASGVDLTGSLSVSSDAGSVSFTNIVSTSTVFTSDYVINGVAGSLTLNADGSGTVRANAADGTWTLSWDSAYNATLTAPGGSVQHLGNLQSL